MISWHQSENPVSAPNTCISKLSVVKISGSIMETDLNRKTMKWGRFQMKLLMAEFYLNVWSWEKFLLILFLSQHVMLSFVLCFMYHDPTPQYDEWIVISPRLKKMLQLNSINILSDDTTDDDNDAHVATTQMIQSLLGAIIM